MLNAYWRHDPHAVYRSLHEWIALSRLLGLEPRRLSVLHRVQVHVAAWATKCDLDFAPMAYLLLEKQPLLVTSHGGGNASSRRGSGSGSDALTSSIAIPPKRAAVRDWHTMRRREERSAGLTCGCTAYRCSVPERQDGKCAPKVAPRSNRPLVKLSSRKIQGRRGSIHVRYETAVENRSTFGFAPARARRTNA